MGLQDRDWYWEAKKEKELLEARTRRLFAVPEKKKPHWFFMLIVQLLVVGAIWAFAKYVLIPKYVHPDRVSQSAKPQKPKESRQENAIPVKRPGVGYI